MESVVNTGTAYCPGMTKKENVILNRNRYPKIPFDGTALAGVLSQLVSSTRVGGRGIPTYSLLQGGKQK